MSVQTKEYLKTRFETGDIPTQQDFEDLIDSSMSPAGGNLSIQYNDSGNIGGSTDFTINPVTGNAILGSPIGISIDNSSGYVFVGDYSEIVNKTNLLVDQTTEYVRVQGNNGMTVNDSNSSVWMQVLPSSSVINMGNLSGPGNGTQFSVNDSSRVIYGVSQVGGVGGNFSCGSTAVALQYNSALTQWGFGADEIGGGRAFIYCNGFQWTWPQFDGRANSTLISNGSGILSFNGNAIYSTKISLSSAQILNLNSSPITLVSSPGAGKFIEVLSVIGKLNYNSIQYATQSQLSVYFSTGNVLNSIYYSTNFLFNSFSSMVAFTPTSAGTQNNYFVNDSLAISVKTANPTAGDSTLDIYVTYKITSI